ncbi:MAG: hypothetical protein PVF83_04720 [Anaerolineales bacterium]
MFRTKYLICGGWRHPPHPAAGGGTLPGPLDQRHTGVVLFCGL